MFNQSINQSKPDLKRASASDLRFPFFECVFRPQARSNNINWKKKIVRRAHCCRVIWGKWNCSLNSQQIFFMSLGPDKPIQHYQRVSAPPCGLAEQHQPAWGSQSSGLMLLGGFWLFSFFALLFSFTVKNSERGSGKAPPANAGRTAKCIGPPDGEAWFLRPRFPLLRVTDEPQDLLTNK